jgi:hypothetical protein
MKIFRLVTLSAALFASSAAFAAEGPEGHNPAADRFLYGP